jgi:hypothetical protein
VSFSRALCRLSFLSISASAPRPLGSNLSLVPLITPDIRERPSAVGPGDEGDPGKLGVGDGTPREVGRPSLRLGKEMELDRV